MKVSAVIKLSILNQSQSLHYKQNTNTNK